MAPIARPWVVTPHEPIVKHEDNLWTIDSWLPGAPITRRMCVVRRSTGALWFFHAFPLDEATLAALRAWGTPEALVLGHAAHGRDAESFAQKLGVKLYGPRSDEAALRKKYTLGGLADELPADPCVRFSLVEGTKRDLFGQVQSGPRVTLLFSDVYQDHSKDPPPLPFRVLGFQGGPKVVPFFRVMFTRDKKALKAELLRLAALPGLARIIPTHGPIQTVGCREILEGVAAALERPC